MYVCSLLGSCLDTPRSDLSGISSYKPPGASNTAQEPQKPPEFLKSPLHIPFIFLLHSLTFGRWRKTVPRGDSSVSVRRIRTKLGGFFPGGSRTCFWNSVREKHNRKSRRKKIRISRWGDIPFKGLYRKSVVSVLHDRWTHGSSRAPLPSVKVSDLNSFRGTGKRRKDMCLKKTSLRKTCIRVYALKV